MKKKASTAFAVSNLVSKQNFHLEVSQLDFLRVSKQNFHLEVSQSDSLCNSDNKPVEEHPMFEEMHRISSNLNGKCSSTSVKFWKTYIMNAFKG